MKITKKISELRKKHNDAIHRSQKTEDPQEYKKGLVTEKQKEVDQIIGISEDEAIKRYAKEKGLEEKKIKEDLKKGIINKDDLGVQKSASDERKESYIKNINKPGKFSTARVGLVGKVKRQNQQVAAESRKKKKKAEDIIKDVLKETGELKEDESVSSEGSSTPTPPSPPPAS